MSGGFPHYLRHREARCFQCGALLTNLSPTANAPGMGHYRGNCTVCGVLTWYDCAEGSVELIDTNESRRCLEAPRCHGKYSGEHVLSCPLYEHKHTAHCGHKE